MINDQNDNNNSSHSTSEDYDLLNNVSAMGDGYTDNNIDHLIRLKRELNDKSEFYDTKVTEFRLKRNLIQIPLNILSAVTSILIAMTPDNDETYMKYPLMLSLGVTALSNLSSYFQFDYKIANLSTTSSKLVDLSLYIEFQLLLPIDKRPDITTIMTYTRNEYKNICEYSCI